MSTNNPVVGELRLVVRGGCILSVIAPSQLMEGWLPDRFLVALPPVRDLLLCAKHLFVEAMVIAPAGG